MSVQNPNEVITKQDLKDFYDRILPFLGGVPELLVTKFNKSDILSETEKIVGCSTNGKPIYQKTFTITDIPNANTKTVPHGISNLGTVLEIKGTAHYLTSVISSGFANLPRVQDNSTNDNLAVDVWGDSILLKGRGRDFTAVFDTVYVTLKYTKTTDAADSFNFGDENDYSTTEKIVGTWIGGEPIYQKTFSFGQIPQCSTSGTRVTKDIAHGISNLARVIKLEGTCLSTSSTYPYTPIVPVQIAMNNTSTPGVNLKVDATNVSVVNSNNAYNGLNSIYVTMQYVKRTS